MSTGDYQGPLDPLEALVTGQGEEEMSEKHFARFGGMTWPLPDHDLIWRLTYGEPSRGDLLRAASIAGAYSSLIAATRDKRAYVVREVRDALALREGE